MARLISGGLSPELAYDMTPSELVFVYKERQREKAEDRLAFISDMQVSIASILSKDGSKAAEGHCKALDKVTRLP